MVLLLFCLTHLAGLWHEVPRPRLAFFLRKVASHSTPQLSKASFKYTFLFSNNDLQSILLSSSLSCLSLGRNERTPVGRLVRWLEWRFLEKKDKKCKGDNLDTVVSTHNISNFVRYLISGSIQVRRLLFTLRTLRLVMDVMVWWSSKDSWL